MPGLPLCGTIGEAFVYGQLVRCKEVAIVHLRAANRVFYGWRLVGIAIFILAVVVGPTFQGMGTFFVALERHFGWSRTMLAGAFSLSLVEGALLGPVEGILTDRLGARRVIFIGFVILGFGLVGLSLIQNIVGFYAAFLVIFTGAGLAGYIPLMAGINQWFVRRRAMAMAIGLTGMNLGGLMVPVLAWAITLYGWRTTTLVMGLATWALSIPVSRMIRNRPEEYGLLPDGDPPDALLAMDAPGTEETGNGTSLDFSVAQALRTSAFWVITVTHGFGATAFVTIAIHIVPALTDGEMSLQMAGTVVAAYTATGVMFQLVGGALGDRLPKPPLIAVFIAIQGLGILVAVGTDGTPGAFLFAVLFGIGIGGRVPLLTAIRGEYFGRKSFGSILGVSQLPMNLIMMGAPILAGYLFDVQGSYTVPFIGLSVMCFLGAGLILLSRKPTLPRIAQHAENVQPVG